MKRWWHKLIKRRSTTTHLWVTVPPARGEYRDRVEIRLYHRLGPVPELVQAEMFDAARDVLARWAANNQHEEVPRDRSD